MAFWNFWKKQKPAPKRTYAGAKQTRLTSDWQAWGSSADTEIKTSLTVLRSRSRQVCRDNSYAKNARRIVVNNVVGSGIGLQSQVMSSRGVLNDRVNDMIERAWDDWCKPYTCHTAGVLAFPDILRMCMSEVVEAGEVLVRLVRQPFGRGTTPLALEVIEADQLAEDKNGIYEGRQIRMGVEVNEWGRPVAYWLYKDHPGDIAVSGGRSLRDLVRVPADDIIHLYLCERWPQTRGVPMLHAALERMNDLNAYSEAEIVAARASANIVGFIKSPETLGGGVSEDEAGRVIDSEPGTFSTLLPGEDFVGFNPSRPNAAMDPFCRLLIREIAAGIGCSYESISKDYSQSNYSSSRLSLLEDRDCWRVMQQWIIRSLIAPVFEVWLDAAVLAGAVTIPDYEKNPSKYLRPRWKPRGWSWIDPTKEVQAYIAAVDAGMMTLTDVIAQTASGQDAEDVFKARAAELKLLESLGLKPAPKEEPKDEPNDKEDDTAASEDDPDASGDDRGAGD